MPSGPTSYDRIKDESRRRQAFHKRWEGLRSKCEALEAIAGVKFQLRVLSPEGVALQHESSDWALPAWLRSFHPDRPEKQGVKRRQSESDGLQGRDSESKRLCYGALDGAKEQDNAKFDPGSPAQVKEEDIDDLFSQIPDIVEQSRIEQSRIEQTRIEQAWENL